MANTMALALFTTSLVLRERGWRPAGRMTARGGLGLVLAAAYLGGRLVHRDRIGVNHADPEAGPRKFVPVLPAEDPKDGELRRIEADATPIVLARRTETSSRSMPAALIWVAPSKRVASTRAASDAPGMACGSFWRTVWRSTDPPSTHSHASKPACAADRSRFAG